MGRTPTVDFLVELLISICSCVCKFMFVSVIASVFVYVYVFVFRASGYVLYEGPAARTVNFPLVKASLELWFNRDSKVFMATLWPRVRAMKEPIFLLVKPRKNVTRVIIFIF